MIRIIEFIKKIPILLVVILTTGCGASERSGSDEVMGSEGLVAFWDFENSDDGVWQSYFDKDVIDRSFPLYLRQIGDRKRYGIEDWPYGTEDARIVVDETGPFGKAIRFNQGYIYGEVPRFEFDNSLLDLKGRKPFTMIGWVKFEGNRHMIAGIWDEGGWDRYAGRRQAALFAGLFNQKGVIAHVSSTGAASFPQSNIDGAQYARLRAIDGQSFKNGEWVSVAMTYDPDTVTVKAYLNGNMTNYTIADPVTEDVMQHQEIPTANPFTFEEQIYSPTAFQIKYNGYDYRNSGSKEHRIWIDTENSFVKYNHVGTAQSERFRISLDIQRQGNSIFNNVLRTEGSDVDGIQLPSQSMVLHGDRIVTSLEKFNGETWQQLGSVIEKELVDGAPFTFGRALGLAEDGLEHGSVNLFVDGVAVFNRVLSEAELKELSFTN